MSLGGLTVLCAFSLPVRSRVPGYVVWLPIVFTIYAVATSQWAELPEAAIRLGLTTMLLAAAVIRCVEVLGVPHVTRMICATLRALMMASVAIAILFPHIGLVSGDYQVGALQGVFNHRNFTAFAAAVYALTAIVLARSPHGGRRYYVDFVFGASCMFAAQSQTSLLTLGVSLVLLVVLAFTQGRTTFIRLTTWATFTIVVSASAVYALGALDQVTQGLGRDTTLTGRTDVWAAVIEEIARRPVLGAGWNAVWFEGLIISNRMWSAAGFQMFHAHNGYLDLLLQVGIVGLVLYMACIVVVLMLSLRSAGAKIEGQWPLVTVLALLVGDLTESMFTTLFGWVLLVATLSVAAAGADEDGPISEAGVRR